MATRIGCESVFLAQDRKGDKGGEVEVIDMFVQKAEDCRHTTVEVMSEAVPQGDGRLGQCGDTTNEENGNREMADEQGVRWECGGAAK